MEYEILAVEWRSGLHTVGFIAYATGFEDEWNSVVGYRPDVLMLDGLPVVLKPNDSEDFDIQYIAAHGAKLEWNIAKEIFPRLDITKYKYYPENN